MDWYDKENWYAPLAVPGEETEDEADLQERALQRSRKRRRRIAGILVIAFVFAVALREIARIPLKRAASEGYDSSFGYYFSVDPDDEIGDELPEDFSEYFSSYYTVTETADADVRIEKTEEPISFAPELQEATGDELTLTELYEKCAPSIVGIEGTKENSLATSWGTGVILRSDGVILTNTHVVDDCDAALVVLSDGSEFEAKLIGADAVSDLALLKIEAEELPAAELGDSSALKTGERVAAIGNPLGSEFTNTLTDGIISAIARDVSYNGRTMTLLQTNAALNEGNSGGALFNMHGQVVGITNMKMMSSYSSIEGIGFAIPSATVSSVAASLAQYGEVRGRPSIGITVGAIPKEIGEYYQMPEGLYVASVAEGSDAERQGILAGDVVTAVDGESVTDSQQVVDRKNQLSVGDKMTFTIWRNGETLEITVTLMDTNEIGR